MSTIAFIAFLLSSRYLSPKSKARFTPVLLENFASNWGSRQKLVTGGYSALSVTHTVRYFKYLSSKRADQVEQRSPNPNDVPLVRDRGTVQRAHKTIPAVLEECRVSLALTFDGSRKFPCFTLIALADEFLHIGETKMVGVRMDEPLNPLHMFLRIFDGIVQHVCTSWTDVVKGLDQELSVKVNEIQ